MNIEGKLVNLLLDCGATVNILPVEDAVAINPKLTRLRPAATKLRMYDNTELKTLGVLTATLDHPTTGK